jgi:predicted nucleic acid-binding protein
LIASALVSVQVLDLEEAQAAGVLRGRRRSHDIVDASVALLARRQGAKVVTSDPEDLRRIDPRLDLVVC